MKNSPNILHVVGAKGSGKTTLILKLLNMLAEKGYRVAALRHSPHRHCINKQGTDSFLFRQNSSSGSGLITLDETAFFFSAVSWDEKISLVQKVFSSYHLVIIEGGIEQGRDRIEVVPKGEKPICRQENPLSAVVCQEPVLDAIPHFYPEQIEPLCFFIEERYLKPSLCAAIIAGGKSSRLGKNKAFVELNGKPAVQWVLEAVSGLVSDLFIVTNTPYEYKQLGLRCVPDIKPGAGAMSGIHAALEKAPAEYVLVLSCDIPLLRRENLHPLVYAYPGFDITIFKHKNFEPLCAIYRKNCISALYDLIDHGEHRIIDLFPSLNVKVIRTDLKHIFRSINTEDDHIFVLNQLKHKPHIAN